MPRNTPKQTKKFITKHLKDTIDRRKQFAKVKQRNQIKDKRRARKVADRAKASDNESSSSSDAEMAEDSSKIPQLKDMSMDDFFQGGFALAEEASTALQEGKPTVEPKLGKRKRKLKENEMEESSDGEEEVFDDDAIMEDLDSASDGDQVNAHKNDLSALASKDPEFYKYLKDNDTDLLDFAAGGDTLVLSDDEGETGQLDSSGKDGRSESIIVTVPMVKKWAEGIAQKHSQVAMRELILAFRAAAHTNEEEGKAFKYTIPDAETYHEVLVTALKGVPTVLHHHLPVKESASGKVRVPTESKKFRSFSPMLNSHAISITHLLVNLSETKAVSMVVSSLQSIVPYFLSFKKSLKNLVKTIIAIWSDSSSSELTRVNAFLVLQRLARIGDASLREAVLKSTYQGLVRSARNTTVHTLPGINVMKNSAAELWGLDPGLGYTTGFTYIRQLAIHLRTSITQPSKENYKAVYNWQYVHSLDFWSRVLSIHCSPEVIGTLKKPSDSPLHPLIYPLVQVTLGALRLVPSPIYFPLRFHLVRSLLRVSRMTHTYIPLAPPLLEVLQSPEMKKPPKNSTLKPLDFDVVIRAPQSYLKTRIYQDGLAEQLSELMAEFFGVWCKNIAFPELVIPPVTVIKRWLKEVSSFGGQNGNKARGKNQQRQSKNHGNRNGKANAHFSLLTQKLQANATFVESHRRKVDFAINDRQGVDAFLQEVDFENTPLGSYILNIRKQKEEKERMLQESRKEDERRRKEEKEDDEENSSMSGEEFSEGEEDLGMAELESDVSEEEIEEDEES